ncbi:TetR/AcrR family transcriptional regulator [Leucobacter aridicollis]|uniref:TetR/AcrR family transcriptional regulator n=1 Tax=Leucobacter aridicollis TaxID=283878 RepID=UPI000E65E1E5|nr:TetR/AcrR family transcriptional regulator [Leucobacter aridicollis]UTX53921.1 TetR/AcrR family transcriptional regulator [Leucobacter aridicollis]
MSASGERRKRGRPTEAERLTRRDHILDAALQAFISRGYGAVTIDEVALAAQVTKRTIYSYFGDKAGIFTAVIERFRAAAAEVQSDNIVDTATRIVEVLFSDAAVGMHRLMIAEASQFPDLAAGFYESGPRGYVALLAEHLPGDRAEREVVAEALFGVLLGEPHRRRLLGLQSEPDPAVARAHAERALALLRVGE